MIKIGPNMTEMGPKMLKIRQIDPDVYKKCVSYSKHPTYDRKRMSCPQNHTAGPQTYWAPRA